LHGCYTDLAFAFLGFTLRPSRPSRFKILGELNTRMNSTNHARIETKLRAARTRLILDKPFIGALVLHLPFESVSWCASIATDVRKIYFNPQYIERLSLGETQFVLAHEAMHCALGHFARRSHRIRSRWDVACDHAVNLLLVDEGLSAPTGALLDSRFRGLSAEEIYPLIALETQERTMDQHVFDGGAGSDRETAEQSMQRTSDAGPSSGEEDSAYYSDDEMWSDAGSHARRNTGSEQVVELPAPSMEAMAQTWQMRLAAAAQQVQRAGRLGTSWQRALGHLLEPMLPWRMLLARYLATLARDDYSFQRPARREGQALLPRLHSGQLEVYVVLDTSGSIGETELREFVAEIDAIKGQVRARVTVHACDDALAADGPWVSQPWEPIVLPNELSGGGGTNFSPVFDWLTGERLRPDVLIYFTDAEGDFPSVPPPFPVLWLVKGRGAVPWGERIQLN